MANPLEFLQKYLNTESTNVNPVNITLPVLQDSSKKLSSGSSSYVDQVDTINRQLDYLNRDMSGLDKTVRDNEVKTRKKFLESLGYMGHKDREEGVPRDIYLEDFPGNPNLGGFVIGKTGQIVVKPPPLEPKKKMNWDRIYWHERGHQGRALEGNLLEANPSKPWHKRAEEQQAIIDELTTLKENFSRAGKNYTIEDLYSLLINKADVVKNPSKAPFENRLDYLPKAPESMESLKNIYSNLNTVKNQALSPSAMLYNNPSRPFETFKEKLNKQNLEFNKADRHLTALEIIKNLYNQ